MFRKPPLKTYQRKAGGASSTFAPVIERVDISDDKELQPQEFLAFRDSDASLEYNPFDTTFDRLARDAKMPPIPQNPAGESLYNSDDSSSSSSNKDDTIPLPEPLPLINPRASMIRRDYNKRKNKEGVIQLHSSMIRRNYNKQKTSKEVSTVQIRQKKRGRGLWSDSSVDENVEPNAKHQKLGKRNRNKKDSKEIRKAPAKKNRRVAKKSVGATDSEDGVQNIDASESLKYCRVSLTRVNVPQDKSQQVLTSEDKSTNGEKTAEVSADPGPKNDEKQDEIVKNGPKEKLTSEFKSPIVLLKRLNVPQSRFSVSDKFWVNSTPIDRRIRMPEALDRLSPIATSMETTDCNEDHSYAKVLTPKNLRTRSASPNHSEQQEGNSTKKIPRILSASPDPQPSGMLFDESEIPNQIADSLEENENGNEMEKSSAGPSLNFSQSKNTQRYTLRVVLSMIKNRNDVTDASTASPFKGFNQSTDPGPLKLMIEGGSSKDSDKTIPDLSASMENFTADASSFNGLATEQENDSETAKNRSSVKKRSKHRQSGLRVARKKSLKKSKKSSRSSSQESLKDVVKIDWMRNNKSGSPVKSAKQRRTMLKDTVSGLENIFQRSAKKRIDRLSAKKMLNDSDGSVENSPNVSNKNSAGQESSSKQIPTVRVELFKENADQSPPRVAKDVAKDLESSSEKSAKDTSEKLNSDDEWATISDLPEASSMSSRISENATEDDGNLESIVHLSSADESTPLDDIEVFVDANENSSRRKFIGDESSSFEENTEIDSISEIEESIDRTDRSSSRKFTGEELSSFEVEENIGIDSISEIEESIDRTDRSSSRKFTGEESSSFEVEETVKATRKRKVTNESSELLENMHKKFQPVVLLTRLNIPVRKSRQTLSVDNSPMSLKRSANSLSKSIESFPHLILSSDEENMDELVNDSETASEPMECSVEEENASQKSQDFMESLEVNEESENTMEIEESAVAGTSALDSSRCSIREDERSLKRIDEGTNGKESLDKHSVDCNNRSIQPIVLLNRLHDPIRITDRRRKYGGWGLSAITENLVEKNSDEEPTEVENRMTKNSEETLKEDIWKKPKKSGFVNVMTVLHRESIDSDVSVEGHELAQEKIVYLKPGKSWSRSLSLFRQVQNQDDIDALAAGKGKKWRQSVQSILAMQPQGVIQSCFKKNEDNKEPWSSYGGRGSAAAWIPGGSQPVHGNTSRVLSQTSIRSSSPASRFVRRVSIRVVPDGKNCELYEDSPFLEAYGITSSQNRKTIGETTTPIAPRKTLVYNVQLPDVTLDKISKRLTSVTSRDVVLAQCDQESSLPFEECFPDSYLQHCRKIGEGVFGEVFLYEKGTTRNVIKIIPIEGELKVNGERQKKFDEILSEIVIAKELNNLRFAETSKTSSFVEVKSIKCLVGKYPEKLLDLWKIYDEEKHSDNDCPDMFDANQLYIVLELGHGGQDLEAFVFQNSTEAHALFVQTALALAVAEESLEFEHRDLHWGNVLISRTGDAQIEYRLRNKDIRVASKGVKCSVIDFTLSRMSYQGCCIFNDLSLDDDLFAAQGEYQFEIYRLMRQKVENNWQTFEPFTNVLWLHYTLDKMITAVRYRRTGTKLHKAGLAKLTQLKNEILSYCSAFDFVTNCDSMTRLQGSRTSVSTTGSSD